MGDPSQGVAADAHRQERRHRPLWQRAEQARLAAALGRLHGGSVQPPLDELGRRRVLAEQLRLPHQRWLQRRAEGRRQWRLRRRRRERWRWRWRWRQWWRRLRRARGSRALIALWPVVVSQGWDVRCAVEPEPNDSRHGAAAALLRAGAGGGACRGGGAGRVALRVTQARDRLHAATRPGRAPVRGALARDAAGGRHEHAGHRPPIRRPGHASHLR